MKYKKLLLNLASITALTTGFATVVSCTDNRRKDPVDQPSRQKSEPSAQRLRELYRQNNVRYNEKIASFAKELDKLKTEYSNEKDETKKLTVEDKIFNLFFEAKVNLTPLVHEYNYLFTRLREAESLENSKLRTIKIFHSNDEHGRIEFDDSKYNKYAGMVETSKYLADKKRDLLISAGDMVQGLPLSDSDKGKTISQIAKYMQYDSVTVGNHEFDYGLEHILKLNQSTSTEQNNVSMPFISANIYYKDYANEATKPQNYDQAKVGQRVFKPYITKTLESGIKVAVIGLTTPDTVYTSHPKNSALVEFRAPSDELKKVVNEIKQNEPEIKFIIAATHLGTGRNDATWTSDYIAAQDQGEGLDLIIDGHSHSLVPINNKDKVSDQKNIYITQTEAYTKYLGDIDITFDTETGKITEVFQVLRDISQIEIYNANLSDRLLSRLKTVFAKENSVKVFDSPGVFEHVTSVSIDGTPYWKGRLMPTSLGTYAADALAWGFVSQEPWTTRDNFESGTLDNTIGLLNGGGLRSDLKQGEITRGNALAVSPFGNRIAAVRVKGSVLVEALKHGLGAGKSGGFSQLSTNISYTVNAVKKLNTKTQLQEHVWEADTTSFKINGKAIDPNKNYYIVTNDFILAGGDGYTMLNVDTNEGVTLAYEGDKYIDTLIDYAKKVSDSGVTLDPNKFESNLASYLNADKYSKQVVNIPEEAKKVS